jgi:hypothetical protein
MHGRGVGAAQVERRLDGHAQPSEAVLAAELEQLDHRLGAQLAPLALHERLPQAVVASWPASVLTPLGQRLAACQRARLALESSCSRMSAGKRSLNDP